MRKLPETVQRAFQNWIDAPTWYKAHPADEARFYAFVWAAVRFMRGSPLMESDIRDLIAGARGSDIYLDKAAHRFSTLFRTLHDFAEARKAPGVMNRENEQALLRAQKGNER